MNHSNPQPLNPIFRRIGGIILSIFLFLFVTHMAQQDLFITDFINQESTPEVNWTAVLSDLGYPLRNEMSGDSFFEDRPGSDASHSEPNISLYARAAALIDADTGRILYGKDEFTEYPMASTTKIMTCIIALEYGNLDNEVTVSSYAASQPEVRLGIRAGEKYTLRDLLYGTMLTSYNDCAVAIAEHIGGSVEGFAALMNQKARDLGCYSTWYITPNGLDAENEGGVHRTTAADLARILAYAIQNKEFLTITRTGTHSFTDCSGKRSFTVANKNAFLSMMEGALSGKTGYTADAGYCYAGALTQDGKTFVVALLGSGWPPQKTRKWSDTRALMNYGLENYEFVTIGQENLVTEVMIPVDNGTGSGVKAILSWSEIAILAAESEQVTATVQIPKRLQAPVTGGAVIGNIQLWLEDEPVLLIPVILSESIEEFTFSYCVEHIFACIF